MTQKSMIYRKLAYRPWPVTVILQECDEATGEVTERESTFIGHFRPLKSKEVRAIRQQIFGDERDPERKKCLDDMAADEYAELEAKFFFRLLCGWAGVRDESGATLELSEELLTEMCTGEDGAAFRRGFNTAAVQIALGVAPRKNSKPSPAPGPSSGEGTAAEAAS